MKRGFLITLFFLGVLFGCSKKAVSLLTVDKAELFFNTETETETFDVFTEGTWVIGGNLDMEKSLGANFALTTWCEFSPYYGTGYGRVTVTKKSDNMPDNTVIQIFGEHNTVTVNIKKAE